MHEIAVLNAALTERYLIDREVGAGGMATVYLARDIRHDRRVALKVLKPELGAVLGVERFLAEIRVTANLQHPTLLPLFDSGAAEGLLFYVMPFVEGESLRARLDRERQLPIDEVLHIAAAVASALDYAHRQGVIHRDLKPENILLHEGEPVVADFGIALAVSNAGAGRITQTGLSLGTPQYMSPEQATGDRAIDGRTDIYSLAAVTYEMLTGETPHAAGTSQAVIARLLTERPRSIRALRPNVAPHVEAAVERALEKIPADRFATSREFADALTGKVAMANTHQTGAAPAAPVGRSRRETMLAIALGTAVVLLVATGGAAAWYGSRPTDVPVGRFQFETPIASSPLQLSISPDGRHILFAGSNGAAVGQMVRSLDAMSPVFVAGTEETGAGAWSPDGREIAISKDGRLVRLPRAGGAPQVITATPGSVRGISWGPRGTIIFASQGLLYRVAIAGGAAERIDVETADGVAWEHPTFLPDGKRFLVLARSGSNADRGIHIASLEGGPTRRLMGGETRVVFVEPDLVLYVRDETLLAQRIDLDDGVTKGEPTAIAVGVGVNMMNGAAGFAASSNGTLAFRALGATGMARLTWYSRRGEVLEAVGDTARVYELSISPDGRRVAMVITPSLASPERDLWVTELATQIRTRLTRDTAGVSGIAWTPDSRSIAYRSAGGPEVGIHRLTLGRFGDTLIFSSADRARSVYAEQFSPDGGTLLIRASDSLLALPTDGSASAALVTRIPGMDEVRFSPDGKQISYNADVSGAEEVYVASYPAMDNVRQISAAGGMQARWRGDGRELLYLSRDGKVMSAELRPGSTTEFLPPTMLFQGPLSLPRAVTDQWDVSKDGQRILFPTPLNVTSGASEPITVITNWRALLEGGR